MQSFLPVMSWKFHIGNVNYRNIVVFRIPSEIGFYSVDGERNFHNDNRQMKWIYKPPSGWDASLSAGLDWDLNAGYVQDAQRYFIDQKKMELILQWILYNQEKIDCAFLSPKSNDRKIDFVCSRGLLTKICTTLHDNSDWSFCATKFKSVIYMCPFETDRQIFENENETEPSKLMTSWGDKFEQYMTSDTPNSKPNTSIPVNKNEGFYIVLKGQINGFTLLYTAEVDGKDRDIPEDNLNSNKEFKSTDCYIELKTAKRGSDRGRFHSQKLFKWWVQSFLAGIPKIICGIRDKNGVVQKLKTYHVESIPEITSSNQEESWKKETCCLKFCHEILQFVKECIKEDDSETVYKFLYEQESPYVKCEQLIDPGEYKILPKWFTAEANHLKQAA